MQADEFDKQLRLVLKGQPFAYDATAWEGMERLLDAEKKKKRAWWMWFWPAMLLAGLGGFTWFANQSISDTAEKAISSTEVIAPAQPQPQLETTAAPSNAAEQSATAASHHEQAQHPTVDTDEATPTLPAENLAVASAAEDASFEAEAPAVEQPSFSNWLQLMKRKDAFLDRQKLSMHFSDAQRPVDFPADIEPKQPLAKPSFAFGPQLGGNYASANAEKQVQMTALGGVFAQMQWKRLLLSLEPTLGFVRAEQGRLFTADTNYAFGYTITTDELLWNDQLEIQLPVLLGITLGKRHQLLAGPVFHHYLNSAFAFERIRTTQGQGTTVLAQQSGRGQIPGLAEIPASWLFRYQFKLNDAFGLGIQYHRTVQPANALNWQLQLRYQLVKIR